ncbi:MAG: phosphotransferase, partial [Ktedonobacteraceae bacterium]|nr:phosphotransferase [Ktedonobacteraceae bacterium]
MHEHDFDQSPETAPEDLLDLNEVMQAFGISEWKNLGPDQFARGDSLTLLVEVQGQRYSLRERPEGMLGEDLRHRYAFRRYLRQAGIPIPDLWLTSGGEPVVMRGEDAFELQRWPGGELFGTGHPRHFDWIEAAGGMLGRLHHVSRGYKESPHRWPSEVRMGAMVQGWLNLARAKADESEIQAVAAALSHCVDQWEMALPAAMMSIGAGGDLP